MAFITRRWRSGSGYFVPFLFFFLIKEKRREKRREYEVSFVLDYLRILFVDFFFDELGRLSVNPKQNPGCVRGSRIRTIWTIFLGPICSILFFGGEGRGVRILFLSRGKKKGFGAEPDNTLRGVRRSFGIHWCVRADSLTSTLRESFFWYALT